MACALAEAAGSALPPGACEKAGAGKAAKRMASMAIRRADLLARGVNLCLFPYVIAIAVFLFPAGCRNSILKTNFNIRTAVYVKGRSASTVFRDRLTKDAG